jgi:lysophospholipid acyltransferase (LPLAT)-like uncharacterized protein
VGFVVGLVARLWLATLRVHVVVDGSLVGVAGRPWILCFFHGTQFPLLAWHRRRRTVALVSHSRDGSLQASALRCQGLDVVRGSNSNGGARGLAALIRAVRRDAKDAAFAVDGPRGPYGLVKEGAVTAAKRTGGVLVPMGSFARRAFTASRAWDRFALPLPFSSVTVVLGAPIEPTIPDARGALEAAIGGANVAAAGGGTSRIARIFPDLRDEVGSE